MNLQEYTRLMHPAIETGLREFIDRSLEADYLERRSELRSMLTYHMGWEGEGSGPEAQGKRIRPLLVLLCTEAAGSNWPDALPAAIAVELLHNFSLIHDDIQDNSPLRHRRSTVWVKWGVAQAINAGDVMFTLAFLAMQDLAAALPPERVLLASRIIQQTCLRLTEGQFLDMSFETEAVIPEDVYWPMISGKTSALLACCTELGALIAGSDENCRAAFREYGYSLGLAFQVLDDWLGIWGDVALTGKSAESDLVSGKKTLPVLHALAKDGPFAQRWLQGKITPEEVPALARMLEDEGAHAYTLETASRLTAQAERALQEAVARSPSACASDASRALEELTHVLLKRKH